MIKNLQTLRGLAAILIYYHHYGFQSDICCSFGDFGVVFFMMLSGFVIYLSAEHHYSDSGNTPTFSRFMLARLSRIYPLYLVCWLAAIVIMPYAGSLTGKALGLFALQSWVPDSAVYFAGNAVAWFVSDLIFCYALFVPLYTLIKKRARHATLLIIGYYLAYSAVVMLLPQEWVHAIIYINPLMQFANFLTGILLCMLFLRNAHKASFASRSGALTIASLALVVACMTCYGFVPTRYSYGCYWWVAAAMCIYFSALSDRAHTPVNKLLHNSILQRCSNVSFSLYLIHYIGIDLWRKLLTTIGWESGDLAIRLLQSAMLLSLLLAASHIIYKHFEQPLTRRLTHLLR